MEIGRKFFAGILIAASLLVAPAKTKAGPIKDYTDAYFGKDNDDKKQDSRYDDRDENRKRPHVGDDHRYEGANPAAGGNSVPIDGGLVILLAAGLGLGVKVLHDHKRKLASA